MLRSFQGKGPRSLVNLGVSRKFVFINGEQRHSRLFIITKFYMWHATALHQQLTCVMHGDFM